MSLSSVAVTSILVVGLIVAGGILLQSITFNLERFIEGYENLNEINSSAREIEVNIENISVSAKDAVLRIDVLNEGQREVSDIYVMVDGSVVLHENSTVFPYETITLEIPLEKANLRRGSRIKVLADGFAAYAVYP